MVKVQEPSEFDKLDRIMVEVSERFGHRLRVEGWTRKTYEVFLASRDSRESRRIARVESFVTQSGEITIFDDAALPWAEAAAKELEEAFDFGEATIVRAS